MAEAEDQAGNAKHAQFSGRVLMVGYGSIGQALLPVLLRHIDVAPESVTVLATGNGLETQARSMRVNYVTQRLTEGNFEAILDGLLQEGDFLVNVSVDVSSLSLIRYCWSKGVLYLDTCTEPWPGRYQDADKSPSQRSNYALREEMLGFRLDKRDGPTAVITMGANPGLASLFVKQALLQMARHCKLEHDAPACYEDWAKLAQQLSVKVIHIAERDTQNTSRRKQPHEFVNTWSVDGFISEGLQPAELGWGSHEKHWPADAGRHGYGSDAAIYLNRPGAGTRVRSWTPLEGPYHGFLVTHAESISIAHHLMLREGAELVYRPTVHYAYHPCDDAVLSLHELAGKNWQQQENQRILREEIEKGTDELGVLLMGNPAGVYWYGSRLTIEQARALAPYNTATSLQVVAGILAGMVWAIRNPRAGLVEPDDIDFRQALEVARPYLGEVVGVWSDWTPLKDRSDLFSEARAEDDPWQFVNFRVA